MFRQFGDGYLYLQASMGRWRHGKERRIPSQCAGGQPPSGQVDSTLIGKMFWYQQPGSNLLCLCVVYDVHMLPWVTDKMT
jgi:hypothetical protein